MANGVCFPSAVIEHTNRVIFLEDDDVAAVVDGRLSIHRIKRTAGDHPGRAVQTLQMELQQIMKGKVLWLSPVEMHGSSLESQNESGWKRPLEVPCASPWFKSRAK